MKRIAICIVLVGLAVPAILFFAFHDYKPYTKYDSKYDAVTQAFVSQKGEVILVAQNSFLRFKPSDQFSHFTNDFPPSEVDGIQTPKWSDFISGLPSKEMLADFQQVQIVKGSAAISMPREQAQSNGPDKIVLRNEFVSYRNPRAWLQLQLLSDNPEWQSYRFRVFFIELPAERKWKFFPKPMKFMSIGG